MSAFLFPLLAVAVLAFPAAALAEDENDPTTVTVVRAVPPRYPVQMIEQGIEDVVVLRVRVSKRGKPKRIRVAVPASHVAFNKAARRAMRKWRFEAVRAGSRVAVWVNQPLTFRIKPDKP